MDSVYKNLLKMYDLNLFDAREEQLFFELLNSVRSKVYKMYPQEYINILENIAVENIRKRKYNPF